MSCTELFIVCATRPSSPDCMTLLMTSPWLESRIWMPSSWLYRLLSVTRTLLFSMQKFLVPTIVIEYVKGLRT
jgi:hypothetical protein